MDILAGFIVILLVVTVIGHGLWKIFALIGRALFGPVRRKPVAPPIIPLAKPIDELAITLGELSRLRAAGLLDPALHAQVIDALTRSRSTGPPVAQVEPSTIASPAETLKPIDQPLPLPAHHAPEVPVATPDRSAPIAIRPKPARPWSELLAAFMQQNNIRWGELIGGLLIIGGSAALVASFWAEIAQRPIFKFSLFTAVTAALFGIGLYSEHRWKLPTTSRGVLLIATLLVPLNCLALAAFSPRGESGAFTIGSQLIALILFTFLMWLSATVTAPQWPGLLATGAVLLSAFMLVLRLFAKAPPGTLKLFALAAAPVAAYVLLCAVMLRTARRWKTIRAPAAEGIFLLLGVFTFATILGLLLLISQESSPLSLESISQTLRQICSAVSAAGLPALTAGLLVWKRSRGVRSNAIRITGGAIAIVGGGVLLLGLALAWPQPSAILPVATFDFATLLVIAFLYELPAVLCLSIPCLGVAWLVGFHVIAGHIAWRDASGAAAKVFVQPTSGTALAPFAILLAVGSLGLFRGRRMYAQMIGSMSAAGCILSLLLLNSNGFGLHGDPYFATWIYLAFALVAFLTAQLIPLDWLVVPGWAFVFATLAQFFVARDGKLTPWAVALFAWATIAALAFTIRRTMRRAKSPPFDDIRYWIALVASAIGAAILSESKHAMSLHVPMALFWLGGVWLMAGIGARQILVVTFAICSAVTAFYIRSIHPAPLELSALQATHSLLLNSTALSLMALVTSRFHRGFALGQRIPDLGEVLVQLILAGGLFAVILIPATLGIAFDPGGGSLPRVGGGWTWLAAAALTVALFGRRKLELDDIGITRLALTLLTFAALVACTVSYVDRFTWNAYHTLLAGCTAVGWIILGYGVWIGSRLLGISTATAPVAPGDPMLSYHQPAQSPAALAASRAALMFRGRRLQTAVFFGVVNTSVVAVLLSTRAAIDDPAAPWWAVGAIVGVATLLSMLASWAYKPRLLYPASILFNLTATIWYAHVGHRFFAGNLFLDFVLVNVIVLSLSGVAWLVLDVNVFYAAGLAKVSGAHRSAAIGSILALGVMTAFCACAKVASAPVSPPDILLLVGALGSIAVLVAACLWERGATQSPATLYAVGLLAIAALFAFSSTDARSSAWVLSMTLAGYALLTAALWALRRHVEEIARVVAIPVDARSWPIDWLIPTNTVLVLITVAISYWADLAFADRTHRIVPAAAGVVGGCALALLALGNIRITIRQSALGVFALSAVAVAWAMMSPIDATLLDRTVAVFVVLAALAAVYMLVVPRIAPIGSAWISVAISEGVHVGVVAGLAMLVALGVEVFSYVTHSPARMSRIDIALLLVALLATTLSLLIVAIRKNELTGWIRSALVYGAEASLALAFVHLRVTMPQLFGGAIAAYWPLVLMAIAFAGVGSAEALRRRYDAVLVRPIENSGIFLPLLPVLAFWLAPPRSVDFGTLLLSVAIFYGLVSVLRRSFLFAIAGVLAANGALWYLLHHVPGWGFLQHPQVWLIPGSLAVLIAAQFNRRRMTAEQMRALRYACLLVIYASSTADVFLNGVATQPWLPLVLATFSVIGALLGIVLRIRPFLYLGIAFLAVSIFTMINYASSQLHWTWIWWVALILLGGGIIILFGLFEKKRASMIGFVEGLRTWQ